MNRSVPENLRLPRFHRITFEPMGVACHLPEGKSIRDAASGQNIPIRSDCGGKGQCRQCLVTALPAEHLTPPTPNELDNLSPAQIQDGRRLACEAKVRGPLTVTVSDDALDRTEAIGKAFAAEAFTVAAGKHFVHRGQTTLGLSMDIGTTTLAVYLCDLESGRVCASIAEANPQRRFGDDVISRILYASENEKGLSDLRLLLTDKINSMISACLGKVNAKNRDIRDVTVVGNTTMQHIFAGLHPRSLGAAPYTPVTCAPQDLTAGEVGLNLDSRTRVHVFPVISGFVGGDTLGVMLAEKPFEKDEVSLIIDIGTNGEIILGNRAGLWVTSCATGPALEGAHIECGMRASAGAIHKVSIEPSTYRVAYEVLNKAKVMRPLGICGSGIIDAAAEMRKTGLMLPSGRLSEGLPGVIEDEQGIGRKFIIVSSQNSLSPHRDIYITLTDIRQIQLAKSALSVGIKLLMRKAGIDRFDRLVLTGAFGARFNWKNAVKIGMLPESACRAEVATVVNAAGQGAILALTDPKSRKIIQAVAQSTKVLELAEESDFAEEFAKATMFPEQAAF